MLKYEIEADEKFSSFTRNIKNEFDTSNDLIHNARNKIKILQADDVSVVVKSYKVPSLFNKIVYSFLRKPKAYRAYHYAIKLEELNVNTAKAYAYICFYKNYLLDQSYFVCENIEYDFTMKRVFDDDTLEGHDDILVSFGEFTRSIHDKDVEHKDYSPGNILVKKSDNGYKFSIIDINRMKFGAMSFEQRMANLSKLWTSEDNIRLISKGYCLGSDIDEDLVYEKIYTNNKNNKKMKLLKKKMKIILGLYKEKG